MDDQAAISVPKPPPSPSRDEKLPPLPRLEANGTWSPPAPRSKVIQNPDPEEFGASSPTSASTPQTSSDSKPKKANPLTDLIDSEKVYVDLLTGIIRKVASAWSRSNLPPPELDTMFRSVEGIHKANRSLLAKLKEIGTNPSSPKALGDLLMRWIDDLETPYTTYSTKYCCGFDVWEPVQSNERLRTVLAMFSSIHPPPLPASSPAHPSEPPIWTLDELFLIPKERLNYYRKLYTRLLKSTTPGRSDHRLLSGALEKLEKLISTVDERANVKVGGVQLLPDTEDEIVIDLRSRDSTMPLRPPPNNFGSEQRESDGSNSTSSGGRRSDDTLPTSEDRSSVSTLSMPVTDLERRLSTERTLDIFTMQPKHVRLQMAPPSLHYAREVRFSSDVVVSVTPRTTGVEVVHEGGHVFILTDLLLVCERMTPQERTQNNGSDMWLLYPPLAGKHLRVAPVSDSDTALSVVIMRKETLILHTTSPALRDQMVAEFRECIDMAAMLLPSKNAAPPPPVPSLPPMMNGTSKPPPSLPRESQQQERSMSPPARALSPPQGSFQPGQFRPSPPNQPLYPPRTMSANEGPQLARDPSFGPGQGMPPQPPYGPPGSQLPQSLAPGQLARGPSFGSGQMMPLQPGMSGPGHLPGQLARDLSFTSGRSGPSRPSFEPGQTMPSSGPASGQLARDLSFSSGRGGPPQSSFEPGQTMPPGEFQPGQRMPPGGFQPGQRMPPGGFQPGQPMPHSGFHPEQTVPPQSFGPGPGQFPPRDSSFRPPPLDAGLRPGLALPSPGRGPSGGFFIGPGGPPSGPLGGLPGNPSPHGQANSRPPSDSSYQSGLRNSSSSRSLRSQPEPPNTVPPIPVFPADLPPPSRPFLPRTGSSSSLYSLPSSLYNQPRPVMSSQMSVRSMSTGRSFQDIQDPSPPGSPVEETPPQLGPTTSTVSAQMKCKVFLQQQHAQWKSLGSAKLKLYREDPTNIKQLVVEADNKEKSVLISTIVLSDGVERVGKTGVAVELSDKGRRAGIIYMIQLKNEKYAQQLFDSLLAGSDRHLSGRAS